MSQFNLKNTNDTDQNYQNGLLPQRNDKNLFYQQSSSRCNLKDFVLSSENRRIIKKTQDYTFQKVKLSDFNYNLDVQKEIFKWIKELQWDYPISSVKNVFTNHIFNYLYLWKDSQNNLVAYSLCYFSDEISHIAYVFYNPKLAHTNLPIRMVLQVVCDSHDLGLRYCYLGRFSKENGFYKRNMPGFEYFQNKQWLPYTNLSKI